MLWAGPSLGQRGPFWERAHDIKMMWTVATWYRSKSLCSSSCLSLKSMFQFCYLVNMGRFLK